MSKEVFIKELDSLVESSDYKILNDAHRNAVADMYLLVEELKKTSRGLKKSKLEQSVKMQKSIAKIVQSIYAHISEFEDSYALRSR